MCIRDSAYGLYMEVRTMTEDEDGRIWVGTMDGLMSFDGHFTTPEQDVYKRQCILATRGSLLL